MSNLEQVKINRPSGGKGYAITIAKISQTDTKPTQLKLKALNQTKSYSYPSDAKNHDDALSIVLVKFFKELNWELPKSGFSIYTLPNDDSVAVEI